MSSIKDIISHLDNELQKLIAPYLKKIDELKLENEKFITEIRVLAIKNHKLEEQFSNMNFSKNYLNAARNDKLLNHIKQLSILLPEEMLDELCISSSTDDAFLLLFHCYNCLIEQKLDTVDYIFELLTHNSKPLLHDNKEINDLINRIFNEIINLGIKDYETIENVLVLKIKLMSELFNTKLKDDITSYLNKSFSDMLDIVLYLNEPKIIKLLLKLLMEYKLDTELKESLKYIITLEWGFLDYNLSKQEFCFFLWYSYLFDLDELLLEKTEESLKWLEDKQSQLQLYTFLYDCINLQKIEDNHVLENLLRDFEQGLIFNKEEAKRITDKVKSALNQLIKKESLKHKYTNKIFVVKESEIEQFTIFYRLQQEEMMIPLYKGRNINLTSGYAFINLYVTEDKKEAFISEETLNDVHRRYYPEVMKVNKYPRNLAPFKPNSSSREAKGQNNQTFQWPSTEIQLNQDLTNSQDQPTLNENSELKKLGYQITGLTRAKRWTILQKAVPEIGLKKVAYTIAYNVRLRKGQKNGLQKFSYAIGEWEFDLDKLKKTYYKKDFTWPNF